MAGNISEFSFPSGPSNISAPVSLFNCSARKDLPEPAKPRRNVTFATVNLDVFFRPPNVYISRNICQFLTLDITRSAISKQGPAARLDRPSVRVLLMLVEHAADVYARANDPVYENKRIARDYEFASATDLPGPADCRIRFEPEGAPPNLSHDPVGSDLAEIGIETLDSQQVTAGTW